MNATRTKARRTDAALVVGNVLWNAAASLFGSVIAFLLVPFLLHRLGEAAYGVWALVGSVFAYSIVFQLGLASAINRFVPVRLASGAAPSALRAAFTSLPRRNLGTPSFSSRDTPAAACGRARAAGDGAAAIADSRSAS